MFLRTDVAIPIGAQPAPLTLPWTLGVKRLGVGIPEAMQASPDVQAHADVTYRLVETVDRLTNRLERETDTALLAIAGWTKMPVLGHLRGPLPLI